MDCELQLLMLLPRVAILTCKDSFSSIKSWFLCRSYFEVFYDLNKDYSRRRFVYYSCLNFYSDFYRSIDGSYLESLIYFLLL